MKIKEGKLAGLTIILNVIENIDTTPPTAETLTMKLGGSEGTENYTNNTWTTKSVYIALSGDAQDEESGIKEVTYTVNGENPTKEPQILIETGIYEIVVITTDNVGNISTNEYTVKIRRPESIFISSNPKKVTYNAYEDFDKEGMKISIKYDNGDIEETTEYTITNEKNLTCEISKIEIQYKKDSSIKTELSITVGHAEVVDTGKAATCTEKGLTAGKHCKVCNTILVEQQEIQVLGHDYEEEVTAPTCLEKGYTTHKCTRCEDSYIDSEIDALGHSFTNYVSNNDATCTQDGTKTAKCDRCEETDTQVDVGSMLQHTEVIDAGKAATCTETGLTEGKHCEVCNTILVKQEEIPALGHNYENGICIMCDKKEPKLEITSDKYEMEELYISKIGPKTTIKEFKENLQTNATEIKVYNKNNEAQEDDAVLTTGMQIELKFAKDVKTFTIVVAGDVTGDGKADFKDMVAINKHRLKKTVLDVEYLMAGDVTEDNKIDFKDMVKINKLRLNKIVQLFASL